MVRTSESIREHAKVAPQVEVRIEKKCPVALAAEVPATPPPPKGVSADRLLDALIASFGPDLANDFWKWLTADLPNHEAEVTGRLKSAVKECKEAPV